MTDQKSAAEAALKEGERNAATHDYFEARREIDSNEARRIFEAGFDRAYALLSTLRAPEANEREIMIARVDAAMVEMQYIHPPLRRSECERLIRAALASAPVAGEAVGNVVLFGEDLKEVSWTGGRMPPPGTTLYAASQASEAVRNDGFSDGVITALEVMTSHGDWGSTAYCELLQAAGLEAVVRRAINEETWETAGLDRTPMAVECRASLSAQPDAQKGGSGV